jgi:predicted transposase/invertase (TIGR01784 family)
MMISICPTVDLAFKLLLGSPSHTAVTAHFLNSVLTEGPPVTQVTILNPFLDKQTLSDKLSVLDIKAQDELGRYFNIEMQTTAETGLRKRITYYVGRMYVGQMNDGMPYSDLRPAISICVLNGSLFPHLPQLHLSFGLRECSNELLSNDLQAHFIELPKSRATAHNVAEMVGLERWAFFLLNAHRIDADKLRQLLPEPEFHEALGVLEMIGQTPETRDIYDDRLKGKRIAEAQLHYATTTGLAKGRAEGELVGQIRLLEELLEKTPTDPEDLLILGVEQLKAKVDELRQAHRNRVP